MDGSHRQNFRSDEHHEINIDFSFIGNFVRHICSQLETKLGDKYDVCNEQPGEKDTAAQTEKELTYEVKSIFSSGKGEVLGF